MAPETELMLAVQYGTLADVRRAPKSCAGQRDSRGMTALMLAVLKGDAEKVKYLLTLEDPAAENAWGLNSADLALKMGNTRILTLIQDYCESHRISLEPSQTKVDKQFQQHILETKAFTGLDDEELRRRTDKVASHTARVVADFQAPNAGGAARACDVRGVRPEYHGPGTVVSRRK